MMLTFVGCGDAFGSGGRFNTCFHVETAATRFLIDCGATSLVALKRLGVDRNAIDTILITHFHADHCGGIPFFILDAQFAGRTRPLTIAGPAGLSDWYGRALETAFQGSSVVRRKFEVALVELEPGVLWHGQGVEVQPALARHGQPEKSFYTYRIAVDAKVIAYTGDGEWTDALIGIGREADLMIAEAYFYDKLVPLHLSYATLVEKLPLIRPKRVVLTHMSDDMLGRADPMQHERAEDGMVLMLEG
jgi:ribonuclease BN (tRNA processing enzyme)